MTTSSAFMHTDETIYWLNTCVAQNGCETEESMGVELPGNQKFQNIKEITNTAQVTLTQGGILRRENKSDSKRQVSMIPK